MAIEYPLISFIASLMFITIVLNALFVYISFLNEINRQPVLSGCVEAFTISNNTIVKVKIIHERGELVKLNKITLYTDLGIIDCETISRNCTTTIVGVDLSMNFINIDNDGLLYTGSIGFVFLNITNLYEMNLFSQNKEYSLVLHFDKGVMIFKFSLMQSNT